MEIPSARASFTLIELLIVIGIIAILAVVVALALNPAELLRQGRDSTRIAEINALNRALGLYQVDVPSGPLGNASTTYFSLVDPTATSTQGTNCQGIPLTAPPSWTYRCAASSTLKNADGTGWLPVNFSQLSFGAPFSSLPVDPVNTSSSGAYYSYTTGDSWALAALLESQKNLRNLATQDGGYDPGRFEQGSDLALVARSQGLVGWWRLDEASGLIASDSSGNGNTGTLTVGTSTAQWVGSAGCKVDRCLTFDGADDHILGNNSGLPTGAASRTIEFWLKTSTGSRQGAVGYGGQHVVTGSAFVIAPGTNSAGRIFLILYGSADFEGVATVANGSWQHVAATYDGTTAKLYVNGVLDSQKVVAINTTNTAANPFTIGRQAYDDGGGQYHEFTGSIDEVRLYNRALSVAEIKAIYDASK